MRTLAIALLALPFAGCTLDFECVADSDCRDGEVCDAGTCASGTRGVPSGGDSGSPAGDNSGPIVDVTPPAVGIISPSPYELISGTLVIEAAVVDDVAVDPLNVTAVIMDSFEVRLTPVDGGTRFVGGFDVGLLGDAAFPSLVVTAYDLARNKGRTGIEFALDTTPPIVSFTSPIFQFFRLGPESGVHECSSEFQPLGYGNIYHGAVIDQAYPNELSFYTRLRIEDQGNGSFPGVEEPVAGVDQTTPKLFLLDNTGLAAGHKLLISDGQGGCKINPEVIPNPDAPRLDQAIVQDLVPATPRGQPLFNTLGTLRPPCLLLGDEGEEGEYPEPLCPTAEPDITLWVGYLETLDGVNPDLAPSIWMLNEYDPENILVCAGGVFDTVNFSANGQACLAATATDRLGFTGVSRPIAICVDRDGSNSCIGFDATVNAAAMCSDGCVTSSYPPDFGTAVELIYWDSSTISF